MEDKIEPTFFCNRRQMPVASDTTDCIGCPQRTWPSPCPQYAHYKQLLERGKLGYTPEFFRDLRPKPDVTEEDQGKAKE